MPGARISFIISTYRQRDMERLRKNLQATVQHPYEIITVDNPGRYSLSAAYNLGARQAQGEFLCFVHEDVVFCDNHWDVRVINRFAERADLGLVGVAGCRRRPDLPIGVFTCLPGDDLFTIRGLNANGEIFEQRCEFPPEECQVRVLDGVFLFTPREVWQELPFDENVKGFHFYDVDFSFRIAQTYRVEVVPNLMLEHISSEQRAVPKGHRIHYNGSWAEAAITYRPNREGLIFDQLSAEETRTLKLFWLDYLCVGNCPLTTRYRYMRTLGIPLSAFHFGLPVLSPRLFRFLQTRLQNYRRLRQERHYDRLKKSSG